MLLGPPISDNRMKRKAKQREKKRLAIAAENAELEASKIVKLAKLRDSQSFQSTASKLGGIDKLAAKHRKERLTLLPKQSTKASRLGNTKDTLPYESKQNGILTIKRLSKSAGYENGLDTLGFFYCFGNWSRLEK